MPTVGSDVMFRVMYNGTCIEEFMHVKEFEKWFGYGGKGHLGYGTMNPEVRIK